MTEIGDGDVAGAPEVDGPLLGAPPLDGRTAERPVSGWRLPPEMEDSWRSRPWARRHWRPLLGLSVIAILVVSVVIGFIQLFSVFGTYSRTELDIIAASNGRITRVNFVAINGRTSFDIFAAPGISERAGIDLACQVVKPILARDGYRAATFDVLDRAGDVLATESTNCTNSGPSASPNPIT